MALSILSSFAMKQLRNSLLERSVCVHPVSNDANHCGQLGHHLLLLVILYFHQGSEGWDILRGYIFQLVLYDPGRDQQGKTCFSQSDPCSLGEMLWANQKYQCQAYPGIF